jgi:hypothetical protein
LARLRLCYRTPGKSVIIKAGVRHRTCVSSLRLNEFLPAVCHAAATLRLNLEALEYFRQLSSEKSVSNMPNDPRGGRISLLWCSVKGLHGSLSEVAGFEVNKRVVRDLDPQRRGPLAERTRSGSEILDLSLSPFA